MSRLDAAMLCIMLAAVTFWISQMATAPVVNVAGVCGATLWFVGGLYLLLTYHRTWRKH